MNTSGTIAYARTTEYDPQTNTYQEFVQRINLATGQATGDPIRISAPASIAITPTGDRLFVVGTDGTFNVLNTATGQFASSPILTLPQGQGVSGTNVRMAVSSDGDTLYVPIVTTGQGNGVVLAVNTRSGNFTTLATIFGGRTVTYDPTRNRLYALSTSGSYDRANVVVIDPATGATARFDVPSNATSAEDMVLSNDGSKLYVLLRTSVIEVDTTTLAATAGYTFDLSSNSEHFIALSPDGKHLAVSGVTPDGVAVVEIDLATGQPSGGVKGLDYFPYAMTYSPDGNALYTVGNYFGVNGAGGTGGIFGKFITDAGSKPTGGTGGGGGPVANPGTVLDLVNFFSDVASYVRVAIPVLAPFAAPLAGANLVLGVVNLYAGTVNGKPYQQFGGALQLAGGIVGVVSLFAGPTPIGGALFGFALLLDLTGALISGLEQAQNAAITT